MTFLFGKKRAQAPMPIPRQRWFADPASVERLRDILLDPVFQLACNILQNEQQPSGSLVTQDATTNNNRLQWLAGYNDFTRDLVHLTRYPDDDLKKATPEWEYLNNPKHTNHE